MIRVADSTIHSLSLCSGVGMKPIPGYEGRYSATEDGRVHSHVSGKCLKAQPTGKAGEYLRVALGDAQDRHYVHVLILSAFVGPPPRGSEARHLDGDGRNNRPWNLAWGTHSANELDKNAHGTMLKGEAHHKCVISNADVSRLCQMRAEGKSYAGLGALFGISKSQAHRIVVGQSRKDRGAT